MLKGLLGQSLGTATIVALQPKVKTIILTSSVSRPKQSLARLFGEGYNPNGISRRVKSSGDIIYVKSDFWSDFDKYDLPRLIKNINCPILLIHGEADEKVSVSEMELYYENANEPKKKIVIPEADHGFKQHREQLYKLVTDWFLKYL